MTTYLHRRIRLPAHDFELHNGYRGPTGTLLNELADASFDGAGCEIIYVRQCFIVAVLDHCMHAKPPVVLTFPEIVSTTGTGVLDTSVKAVNILLCDLALTADLSICAGCN